MRDQRRHRDALELAGHRRRERQDVVHDDIGPQLGDRTPRVCPVARTTASYISNGSPAPGNSGYSGADTNRIPARLDVLAPARPGLERHLVPARRQLGAEREHREGVTGLAERAQEEPEPIGAALKPPARPPRAAARSARGR